MGLGWGMGLLHLLDSTPCPHHEENLSYEWLSILDVAWRARGIEIISSVADEEIKQQG